MDSLAGLILQLSLGGLLILILHELTHVLALKLFRIKIKYLVLTWWTGLVFISENDEWIKNDRILFIVQLSPLIWSFAIFLNPSQPFFWMFPLVSIPGSALDLYFFFKTKRMAPEKRIEWVNRIDEKVMKTAIFKLKLN